MTHAVAAEDVWKYYGDFPALREIGLAVEPGSCLALLGRNGAGKTTLLRIIAGFSKAGQGPGQHLRPRRPRYRDQAPRGRARPRNLGV